MSRSLKKALRRVTANLPAGVLADAQRVTGKGITETLVEGLHLLQQRGVADGLEKLRGKIRIDIDVDELRGRARH